MKRSRSPRGKSRPRFPGDDAIIQKKKIFFTVIFYHMKHFRGPRGPRDFQEFKKTSKL